jgi:deoxyribodipyrimidine photo-lyase
MSTASEAAPIIVWFRDDLRLADHPALHAAAATGAPVIPLFVLDEAGARAPGAASLWWLDKSLSALAASLRGFHLKLVLRRGDASAIVQQLAAETRAEAVYWNRAYEPKVAARDERLRTALEDGGVPVRAFDAALLNPPGTVLTGDGGAFKVFTAFWRAARKRLEDVTAVPAPKHIQTYARPPKSDDLASWGLHPTKPDWSGGLAVWTPGEAGAAAQLDAFLETALADYPEGRDRPDRAGSSRLSPHVRWGEISPRQVWTAVQTAVAAGEASENAGERFLTELGWRDFNWQLLAAHPSLATRNIHGQFDAMAWRRAPKAFAAWTRGATGYPIVDAGMRELWATGFMHNRVRMITASFLIKHLMIDWRRGEAWFWDTLVDADPANNPANWQWVAGSGADASPFFRIFNPILQGRKFDPEGDYVRRWVPELARVSADLIHEPWRAEASVRRGYPDPIVRHDEARKRALGAYADLKESA